VSEPIVTIETLQLCHARALVAANSLRLPLRSRAWKGQAGEFAGSGSGSSLDFQDHRAYSPGDDPRHINWQAYARTGTYTMKLFREEVRPVVELILDASESMFFDPLKAIRVAELVYFIAESSQAVGASLHTHAVRGDATLALDPAALRSHRWLEAARALPASDPSQPPAVAKIPLHANSIRVLLSDLLFPADPEFLLRTLSQRHGNLVTFSPFLATEAKPGWAGNYEFVDPERGSHHPHRIEVATLRRYEQAYQQHFSAWKQQAVRYQAAFARVPADLEWMAALFYEALPSGALEPRR
jgi:uncharacterized protein (DUF58 family)